jgi:flagellar basal-body rod protein FlgG
MDLALAIAKSGLEAQHKNLEIISNNLANASTPSYKKSRAVFEDLPYDVITQPGSPTSQETNTTSGFVMGTGTKLVGNMKIYSDGPQTYTGRPFDVAISGSGFLQVQLPNGGGFAYTRAGSLTINEQGQLTLPNGYVVQPPITLPEGYQSLTISEDGLVSVIMNNQPNATQLGQLQLANFINPDGLQPIGNNLYLETTSSGTVTLENPDQNGIGSIIQNAIEGSNVNVVEEMVNLIEAQRAFEVTSKAVSAVDNMMQYLSRET